MAKVGRIIIFVHQDLPIPSGCRHQRVHADILEIHNWGRATGVLISNLNTNLYITLAFLHFYRIPFFSREPSLPILLMAHLKPLKPRSKTLHVRPIATLCGTCLTVSIQKVGSCLENLGSEIDFFGSRQAKFIRGTATAFGHRPRIAQETHHTGFG